MSDVTVNQIIGKMRDLSTQIDQGLDRNQVSGSEKPDFGALLKESIDKVNELGKESSRLKTAFEQGDPSVSVAEVMIAAEKAGLSFQAMTQVRNRLVSAYQDIMNMPI